MTVIYHTTITRIGASAATALEEQMLITFREGAPADIEEYCFIHNHGELCGALRPGAELQLGDRRSAMALKVASFRLTRNPAKSAVSITQAIARRSSAASG